MFKRFNKFKMLISSKKIELIEPFKHFELNKRDNNFPLWRAYFFTIFISSIKLLAPANLSMMKST
jgi:hypothetical protein